MQETPDINLAVFLQCVQGVRSAGHRIDGRQLLIQFDLTKEQMTEHRHAYINSVQAHCDATRKNWLQILK